MADVIPPINLPPEAQPWGRTVQQLAQDVKAQVDINKLDTDNNQKQLTSSVNVLTENINTINDTLTYLSGLAATGASSSVNTVILPAGAWYTGAMPTVTANTSTGKLMVFVSGWVSGGTLGAALTFSIPGYVDRNVQIQDLINGGAGGYRNGLISPGNSTVNSTYAQLVTGLPQNTDITVKMEAYAFSSGAFTAPAIITQVVA